MKWIQGFRVSFLKASWILIIQLILILCIETYFYINNPENSEKDVLISQSLSKAESNYEKTYQQLISETTYHANRLKELGVDNRISYSLASTEFDFILIDGRELINWSFKAPAISYNSIHKKNDCYLINQNNKEYLAFTVTLSSQSSFTGLELLRNNESKPLANNSLFVITNEWVNSLDFPLQFRTQYDSTQINTKAIVLRDKSDSPLAYLVAYSDSYSLLQYQWNSFKERFRSGYILIFVIISLAFFLVITKQWPLAQRFTFRSVLFIIFWILIANSDIEYHLTDLFIQMGFNLKRTLSIILVRLNLHTLFFIFLSYETIRSIRLQKRFYAVTWYPRTIVFSLIAGILSYFILTSIPSSYYHLVSIDAINLLDPNLFPPIETLLFILGLTCAFGFSLLLTIFGNSFLLNSEQDQKSWVYPFHFLGFIVSHYALIGFNLGYAKELQPFFLIIALYVGVLILSNYLQLHPNLIRKFSVLRQLLVGSFLISLLLYPTLQLRHQALQEKELNERAFSLVDDFLEYKTLTKSTKNNRLFEHDQGIWPGTMYIAAYDSNKTLIASWNRALLPFAEKSKINLSHNSIEKIRHGETLQERIYADNQLFIDHYLYAPKSGLFIRGIIPIIPFQSHVFSLFRFFYCTLFIFVGLFILRASLSTKPFLFFDARENLQSRILDTYLIASLIFLIVLVGTTGFIVSNEEVELHKATLKTKKEQIIKSINDDLNGNIDLPFIRFLAERFEVSLDLFSGNRWVMGASYLNIPVTDPMLALDKDVFNGIYYENSLEVEKWYESGNERIGSSYFEIPSTLPANALLKISLRSTVSGNNEQLLKSVSYLIAVYVFVFGFFIVLAYFISKYLAEPLLRLLQGLRRISSGRLDTIVPVTTQDEIGELANAYNFMIFRLKDLQKELAEVERQAAWSEMARQVAHEIKNPLTPMKLTLQHLQRLVLLHDGNESNLKEDFERISKGLIQQIDSLSNIASDFSKFARPITDELVPLNINQLLTEIDELYQHDQHIKINLDLSENTLMILGVADDLKRVFINLVKNAIEAMPEGGILMLRTYRFKTDVYIEFADTGIGIPVNLQSQVFKPNFSTKTSGTGIGLAISKKVIDAHKGHIQFASVPGSGTTFTLWFSEYTNQA